MKGGKTIKVQTQNRIPQGVLVQFRLGAPSQTILCRSLKCLRICPLAGPPFGPPLCSTGCAGDWEETSRRRGRGPRPQSLSASTAQLTPTVRALRPKRALIERAGAGSRTARGRRASDRGSRRRSKALASSAATWLLGTGLAHATTSDLDV